MSKDKTLLGKKFWNVADNLGALFGITKKKEQSPAPQSNEEEEDNEGKQIANLFWFTIKTRTLTNKIDNLDIHNKTQLWEAYKAQGALIVDLENNQLISLPEQTREKIKNKVIPHLKKKHEALNQSFRKEDFQKIQQLLERVSEAIRESIASKEEIDDIITIGEHVRAVIKERDETQEAIRKRENFYPKKRVIIKELMHALIIEEKKRTQEIRAANRKQQEAGRWIPSIALNSISFETDERIDEIGENVRNFSRLEILKFDDKNVFEIEHKDLILFGCYKADISEEQRKLNVSKLHDLINKIAANEKTNIFRKKLRRFSGDTDSKEDFILKEAALAKILAKIQELGIELDLITLEKLLFENEQELMLSEETGANSLKLYENVFLRSKFFHEKGEKMFMGMYLMLVTLGLLEDEEYDPLTASSRITEKLIVDAYAKRRSLDTAVNSDKRWFATEQILTYYSWITESFNFSAADPEQKAKIVTELLNWFWWNEVGRPSVTYKTKDDNTTENPKEAAQDAFGPIVAEVFNKENVSYPVSKEHGKYYLRKRLTKKALERIEKTDQNDYAVAVVYYQLHTMINKRRSGKTIGIENVPLAPKDHYTISIVVRNKWKKVQVDGKFFTSDEYGTPGSIEGFAHFLMEYKDIIHGDTQSFREFDTRTLYDLHKQAKDGYSLQARKREKYQDIQGRIDNLADFTAADFGISFMGNADTRNIDAMMRSLLTNTFGGRKQLNIIFGVNEQGNITEIAETMAHKFQDGAPARIESEEIFTESLDAVEKTTIESKKVFHDSLTKNATEFEEKHTNASRIYTTELQARDLDLRNRCGKIYRFYKEKMGLEIDKNTVVQLGIHLFLNSSHTHFLDSKEGILAPTLSFYPSVLLEKIKTIDMSFDERILGLAASQVGKADRSALQKNGSSLIVASAMLTGANSVSPALRSLLQFAGESLNPQVTFPLTRSALVSALSGSAQPFPAHELFSQDAFTTALDGVYLDKGAIGLNDYGENITVTYRTLNQGEKIKKFGEEFQKSIELALYFFEETMQVLKNTRIPEKPEKTWRTEFEELSAQRHLSA